MLLTGLLGICLIRPCVWTLRPKAADRGYLDPKDHWRLLYYQWLDNADNVAFERDAGPQYRNTIAISNNVTRDRRSTKFIRSMIRECRQSASIPKLARRPHRGSTGLEYVRTRMAVLPRLGKSDDLGGLAIGAMANNRGGRCVSDKPC
jgi:hypothetical protein